VGGGRGAPNREAVEGGEQPADVGGIVLQVAVHGDDDRAARRYLDAGAHGGGLAEVAAEADDAEVRSRAA
jgi:hypothetical protein